MTAKPKAAVKPPMMRSVKLDAPAVEEQLTSEENIRRAQLGDFQDREIRKSAIDAAIRCGAGKTDVIALAGSIEKYIREGMLKA